MAYARYAISASQGIIVPQTDQQEHESRTKVLVTTGWDNLNGHARKICKLVDVCFRAQRADYCPRSPEHVVSP